MPVKRKPSYTLHKPTGQARVRINGKDHYLGLYGSPESRERYDDLMTEWLLKYETSGYTLTVDDLCLLFIDFADRYYRRMDGTSTGTINNVREALRYLVKHYGTSRVRDFGPKKLKEIRQRMIKDERCRTNVNRLIHWIRRAFRWGVEEELVPVTIHQGLAAVTGLRAGRSEAKESEPVSPVTDDIIERTLPHLPPVVAAMVRFQRLTGCRPGEVCILRPCDVERTETVWRYTPQHHKTEHHGLKRVIMIGPKAQAVLMPYLLREKSAYCFSALDSLRKHRDALHEKRTTPLSCGDSPGTNRKANPLRQASDRYTKNSYNRAISRACDAAFPPPDCLKRQNGETVKQWRERLTDTERRELNEWQSRLRWSPNQLRHTAATEIRKLYGLEAAQVTLGHAHAQITQVYAERNMKLAADVMQEVG